MKIFKMFTSLLILPALLLCIEDVYSDEIDTNGTLTIDESCNGEGISMYIRGAQYCQCFEQYYVGKTCETRRPYCTKNTCLNGGICKDHVGGFTCECKVGFYGGQCGLEDEEAPFASNPRLVLEHGTQVGDPLDLHVVLDQLPEFMNRTVYLSINASNGQNFEIELPRERDKFSHIENAKAFFQQTAKFSEISEEPAYVYAAQIRFDSSGFQFVNVSARLLGERVYHRARYTVQVLSGKDRWWSSDTRRSDSSWSVKPWWKKSWFRRGWPECSNEEVSIPVENPSGRRTLGELTERKRTSCRLYPAGINLHKTAPNIMSHKGGTVHVGCRTNVHGVMYNEMDFTWNIYEIKKCTPTYFKGKCMANANDTLCATANNRCSTYYWFDRGKPNKRKQFYEKRIWVDYRRYFSWRAHDFLYLKRYDMFEADGQYVKIVVFVEWRTPKPMKIRVEGYIQTYSLYTIPNLAQGNSFAMDVKNPVTWKTTAFIDPAMRWRMQLNKHDLAEYHRILEGKPDVSFDDMLDTKDITYLQLNAFLVCGVRSQVYSVHAAVPADVMDQYAGRKLTLRKDFPPRLTCDVFADETIFGSLTPLTEYEEVEQQLKSSGRFGRRRILVQLFRKTHIPLMEVLITHQFLKFATNQDVFETVIGCTEPYPGEQDVCEFYLRKVWWQIEPVVPVATDRASRTLSTFKNTPKVGTTYTIRARARWNYNRFYDNSVQVRVATLPETISACYSGSERKSPRMLMAGEFTLYCDTWGWDQGGDQFGTQDYVQNMFKLYHDNILLYWHPYSYHADYFEIYRVPLFDAKYPFFPEGASHRKFITYQAHAVNTYGNIRIKDVQMSYFSREPFASGFTVMKGIKFLDYYMGNSHINRYLLMDDHAKAWEIGAYLTCLKKIIMKGNETQALPRAHNYSTRVMFQLLVFMRFWGLYGILEVEQFVTVLKYMVYLSCYGRKYCEFEFFMADRMTNHLYNAIAHLSKFTTQLDNMDTTTHIGELFNITGRVFSMFETIIYCKCERYYCRHDEDCLVEEQPEELPDEKPKEKLKGPCGRPEFTLKDASIRFLDACAAAFGMLSYFVNRENQPYWFSTERRFLTVSFINREPTELNYVTENVLLYAPGLRARVGVFERNVNMATTSAGAGACAVAGAARTKTRERARTWTVDKVEGLYTYELHAPRPRLQSGPAVGIATIRHNYLRNQGECSINTTVTMTNFFNDTVRPPYQGNTPVRHTLYEPFMGSQWISMEVQNLNPIPAWTGGKVQVGKMYYFKIHARTTVLFMVFYPTVEPETPEANARRQAKKKKKEKNFLPPIFSVAFSQLRHPQQRELYIPVTSEGVRILLPKIRQGGSLIYMGMRTLKDGGLYNFSTYEVECFNLKSEIWIQDKCSPEEDSRGAEASMVLPNYVACRCNAYNGIFAGKVLAVRTKLDFEDADITFEHLFIPLTTKDYFPVVIAILVFLLLFLVIFYIGNKITKSVLNQQAIQLRDNNITHRYPYLLGVETGWLPGAGTTSNVIIQIYGTQGRSSRHLLKDGYRRVLYPGHVSYFIVLTQDSLGDIAYIKMWHDFCGRQPSWFCRMITICDLDQRDSTLFYVNSWLCIKRQNAELVVRVVPTCEGGAPSACIKFSRGFRDFVREDHPVVAMFLRHPRTIFNVKQRVFTMGGVLGVVLYMSCYFIDGRNPDEMTMLMVENSADPASYIVTVLKVSVVALIFNHTVKCMFRTAAFALPKTGEEEIMTEIDDVNYFKNKKFLSNTLIARQTGGITWKRTYQMCEPLLMVKSFNAEATKESVRDLYARDAKPKKPKKKFRPPNLAGLAQLLCICGILAGLVGGFMMGSKFPIDRAYEFLFTFVASVIFYLMVMEPVVQLVASVLSTRRLREQWDLTGNNNRLIIPWMRTPKCADLQESENINIQLRRHNRCYWTPTPHDIQALRRKHRKMYLNEFHGLTFLGGLFIWGLMFVLAKNLKTENMYYSHKTIYDIFYLSKYSGYPGYEVVDFTDLNKFLFHTVAYGVHHNTTRRMKITEQGWIVDLVHKAMGVLRLRQVRVAKDTCSTTKPFESFKWVCTEPYRRDILSTRDYYPGWEPFFKGQNFSESLRRPFKYEDTYETWATRGTAEWYPAGGYVGMFTPHKKLTGDRLRYLETTGWLDLRSRAVLIELTTYSNDANVFNYVTVLVEILAGGNIRITPHIWTAQLFLKIDDYTSMIIMLTLGTTVFIVCLIQYLIKLSCENWKELMKEYWNMMDGLALFLTFVGLFTYIMRSYYADFTARELGNLQGEEFGNIQMAMRADFLFNICLATVSFIVTIRICKLLLYMTFFAVVSSAMRGSFETMKSLGLMTFILYAAFAMYGYILLKEEYNEFSSVESSLESFLIMTFGYLPIRAADLAQRSGTSACVMYLFFVLLMGTYIFQLFVAVIYFNYEAARQAISPYEEAKRNRNSTKNMLRSLPPFIRNSPLLKPKAEK